MARPICEECDEEMHPGTTPDGRDTWGCDTCGWSFDVQPEAGYREKPKPISEKELVQAVVEACAAVCRSRERSYHQQRERGESGWMTPMLEASKCASAIESGYFNHLPNEVKDYIRGIYGR